MQHALFHERIEDAIDEVVRQCGGRKKLACEMWPDKPAREAHNAKSEGADAALSRTLPLD